MHTEIRKVSLRNANWMPGELQLAALCETHPANSWRISFRIRNIPLQTVACARCTTYDPAEAALEPISVMNGCTTNKYQSDFGPAGRLAQTKLRHLYVYVQGPACKPGDPECAPEIPLVVA